MSEVPRTQFLLSKDILFNVTATGCGSQKNSMVLAMVVRFSSGTPASAERVTTL